MRKKRRLKSAGASAAGSAGTEATGRPTRVRNRLLVGVVVGSLAVLAAGTPGLVDTSGELSDAQERVDLARLHQDATALAHALADERQAVLAHRASDGSSPEEGLLATQRARVDRQVEKVRADAPRRLRHLVDTLPELRRRALGGDGDPLAAHRQYTEAIQELNTVAAEAARVLPASSADRTAAALPSLVRAVEQAAATRDLLVMALAGGGAEVAVQEAARAAQLADVRQRAAVADFRQLAAADARDSYTETVTGPEVDAAERYLEQLADRPWWDEEGRAPDHRPVESALSARVDLMRGVTSALAVDEVRRREQLRDEGVTDLEIQVALLGAFLLIAVGSGVQTARSMARPLAVLRRGARRVAADPLGQEPVRFTGRDDEYADVVRAVNALQQAAAARQQHDEGHADDHDPLAGSRDRLVAERVELLRECEALRQRLTVARQPSGGYAHLALRALELVERQLTVLARPSTGAPEREWAVLEQLAVRIRRQCQNLLVLAGGAQSGDEGTHPEPLAEVVRAATRGIEDGGRITVGDLPAEARVVGAVARDLVRVLAELLDNAVSFSPHDGAPVEVSGRTVADGLLLSVRDQGIGMTLGRMAELNAGLEDPEYLPPPDPNATETLRMGLYVVARLAARHEFGVRLSARREGGIAAEVHLASPLLVPAAPVPSPTSTGSGTGDVGTAALATSGPVAAPARESAREAERAPAREADAPGADGGLGDEATGGREHPGTGAGGDEVRGPVTGPWLGEGAPTGVTPDAAGDPGAARSPETVGQPPAPADPEDPLSGPSAGPGDAADEPVTGAHRPKVGPAAPDPLAPSEPGSPSGARSVAGPGAVPPRTPSPVGGPRRLSSAPLALTDDPLVEAARRAEREAAGDTAGPGPTPPADSPLVGAPGDEVDAGTPDDPVAEPVEPPATGTDALVRAAGPFLVEPGEHVRATEDDGLGAEGELGPARPAEPDASQSPADPKAPTAQDATPGGPGLPRRRPSGVPPLPVRTLPQPPSSAPAPEGGPEPDATAPPAVDPAPTGEGPRTAAGLPQRTPRPPADPGLPPPRPEGRLDPEELRRRLGGFQVGARDGRRAAERDVAAGRDWTDGRSPEHDGDRDEVAPGPSAAPPPPRTHP